MVEAFYKAYRDFLEKYVCEGGTDSVLIEAYENLLAVMDSDIQAAGILDVHTRAFQEIMNIRRDSDHVQWIYIVRATEFLVQIMIVIDSFLLQLKEQVERDHLTGLYNRFALYRMLEDHVARSVLSSSPLVVAVVDIDNFKDVNDNFGHVAGDAVLKETGDIIRRSLRNNDQVFRYGGEEFVALLPGTDSERAVIALERIRKGVEDRDFLQNSSGSIKLTVSIGAVEFKGERKLTPEELIRKADEAMYRAKQDGKNRVITETVQ